MHSAKWGTNCGEGYDVTKEVGLACNGKTRCDYKIWYYNFENQNPYPNCNKNFVIETSCGRVLINGESSHGKEALIRCAAQCNDGYTFCPEKNCCDLDGDCECDNECDATKEHYQEEDGCSYIYTPVQSATKCLFTGHAANPSRIAKHFTTRDHCAKICRGG